MLDQNTDRMWFVIGAVIVGAAIIFIANGTIPEIFASVTDSFEEAADRGTAVIGTLSEQPVNYFDVSQLKEGIDAEVYHKTGRWGTSPNRYDSYILELNLKPNTKYTMSSNVPADDKLGAHTLYFNHWVNANKVLTGHSITVESDDDGYLFVGMPKGRKYTEEVLNGTYWVMLNEGERALPYVDPE